MSSEAPHFNQLRVNFENFDPDQLTEVIAGGHFDHTILNSHTCSLNVRNWSFGDFQVDYGNYSFATLVKGQFPPNRVCIGMVPTMQEPTWINGYEITQNDLQIYNEDVELCYRAGPNTTWCAIAMDRESLQEAALKQFGRPLKISETGVANLTPDNGAMDSLQRITLSSFDVIEAYPETAALWKERIIDACVNALGSLTLPLSAKTQARAHYRAEVFNRADRFLRANIGSPYSSERLCNFLGMSERNLQLHFQQTMGISPKKWFHRLAMNQARFELTHNRPQHTRVSEIARNCGFEHLGRFSENYRKLFGESPSQTIRNG